MQADLPSDTVENGEKYFCAVACKGILLACDESGIEWQQKEEEDETRSKKEEEE